MTGPPVLALVGPTAAGKSSVAMEVAQRLDAEILAIDPFTVYRGMDVGTAKPSAEDRRLVPHHLLDLLDPEEDCSVQWFQPLAREAVDGVLARGRVPLLVGGSGLYFRAVVDDLEFPPTDPATRADVEARYAHEPERAHADLAARDPEAAARIHPANLRRTVRALEVIELTGAPFSAWYRAWDRHDPVYPGLAVVGVDVDRKTLDDRIRKRVAWMLESGLLEECRRLAIRDLSVTARQAIGYREMLDHLESRLSLDEATERMHLRTRRFAFRQQRWFRADPRVEWAVQDRSGDALLQYAV